MSSNSKIAKVVIIGANHKFRQGSRTLHKNLSDTNEIVQTEQQTRSFKEFRDNHRYRDPSDLDVSRLPQYVDNREDLNALLELRDIEDELTTIQKLFIEQHKTIKEMLKQYEELNRQAKHGRFILQGVDHAIEGYEESVKGMLKSADVAQKAVSWRSHIVPLILTYNSSRNSST